MAYNAPDWQSFHCCSPYNDEIKRLIVAAKVKNSAKALNTLISMGSDRTHDFFRNQDFDFFIPAPSSPWSRLRLRTDIAFHWAMDLSNKWSTPVSSPPFWSYWNLRKRSFHKNTQKKIFYDLIEQKILHSNNPFKNLAPKKILLIDDVCTTGWSLRRLRHILGHQHLYSAVVLSGNLSKLESSNDFHRDSQHDANVKTVLRPQSILPRIHTLFSNGRFL